MLTREQNDLLTLTGRGTPGGELMRRYWQPVAVSEEMPADGAPIPVQILGENLVLFRDQRARLGLLGIHCSHRAADLSYGRVEGGGLRCVYHGWVYDVNGNCLEQPCEPEGSDFHTRVKHLSYPCLERGEVIFAYLGPAPAPLFPDYEFLNAVPEKRFVNKLHHECNYLQANEGNIDPAHLSFLHRFLDEREAQVLRGNGTVAGSDTSPNALFGRDVAPHIEIEETDFGIRIYALRDAGQGRSYVRISNFVMPNLAAFPGNTQGDGYSVNWHVPIDDYNHWKYQFTFTCQRSIDKEPLRRIYAAEMSEAHRLRRTRANRYLQDRAEMQTRTFIGMGPLFAGHDKFATEGEGPIQDRTTERLGSTDRAIAAQRQMLLKAIRDVGAGVDPPHVIRDPAANVLDEIVVTSEVVPANEDFRTYWRRDLVERAPVATSPVPVSAAHS
jgi:phenylpropionate dioxygenase-like ring-hydroxylating dioxygenase large terminal subunit